MGDWAGHSVERVVHNLSGTQRTDMPMIRIANDRAIWRSPRSAKNAGIGVMYPDMTKMRMLAGYGSND